MKRRSYLGLVVLVIALSTLSCVCGPINFGTARFGWPGTVRGSGRVAEEERPVSGITGVKLATFGDLTIEVGDEEELRIQAEENLIPYFETEMRNGGVDWRMNLYGGAAHSFTNPDAGALGTPGIEYHEPTAVRSWNAMLDLFAETFG